MEARNKPVMKWVCLLYLVNTAVWKETKGVDIGLPCENDDECRAGNGGAYSKCNQRLSMCICTMTLLGEHMCKYRTQHVRRACKRRWLYRESLNICNLECSASGSWEMADDTDWYGQILEQFSSVYVPDKATSVCYDPDRAVKSLPDGLVVRNSTIPGAGLGTFTEVFIQRDTVFGPYKGLLDYSGGSPYSWKKESYSDSDEPVWIDGSDTSLSNWMRYINMPTSSEMENIMPLQYKGEIFYLAFKSIHPGTELFVWYGESYAKALGVQTYIHPSYEYAKYLCSQTMERFIMHKRRCQILNALGALFTLNSLFDVVSLTVDEKLKLFDSLILPILKYGCEVWGFHKALGMEKRLCIINKDVVDLLYLRSCITAGYAGGECQGHEEYEPCHHDVNTICVAERCFCVPGTSLRSGLCIPNDTFGGKCDGPNGKTCQKDKNTECQRGMCVCKNSTSPANGKCIPDETVDGRCFGSDGDDCRLDKHAECVQGLCYCKYDASRVGQKCTPVKK